MKLIRSGNPILAPTPELWENKGVFNPAVFELHGSIHLLYRAQGQDSVSRFGIARMATPVNLSERKTRPVFEPDPDSEYESLGVEDPRVSYLHNEHFVIYVSASKYPPLMQVPTHPREADWRVRVSLAKTPDFTNWTRYGVIISHIDSKDAALFPQKIDDNFCLLHRVVPQIRIAVAADGRRYKERGPVFGPREGMWDEVKVGVGAPPIKCPFGWILFYHGVDKNKVYRLGITLLDLHDPSLVIARTAEPVLEPQTSWEKNGRVANVVFTCGAIEDSDKYWVYYGGADTMIGVASISKQIVWDWAKAELSKSRYHQFDQIGNITIEP
ncbi:glycosidase [Candidatus Amesbacteria bacterium]|nr:glycosidase [Candidatus Amesbacteria bacterium]